MDVGSALRRRGGVARLESLLAAGVTRYAVRKARESGHVLCPRRGWIALTDADPLLVSAARRGVMLSCITLAVRKGLWVLEHPAPHVAAHPASHARVSRGVIHWSRPVFPRDPDSCEDSIENALILIARCQPHEAALAAWESAFNRGIVDPGVLRRAHLPPTARRLLAEATPFADAGTETVFRSRLRWLGLPIRPQTWILGRPVDFLIGDRLVIQIDGGHHVDAQRTADIAHDALLKLHGYHVIRLSYDQIFARWPETQAVIMAAVAQRLHVA